MPGPVAQGQPDATPLCNSEAPVRSALFLTHDEYLDEPSAAMHFSETLTPAGPRSHTSYTPPEGSQETPPTTCSGCLWMGLAGLSSSLWSHHDPRSQPPTARTLIPSEGKGGTSLDVVDSA